MLTWLAILDSSSNSLDVARRQMPKAASRAPLLREAGLEEEVPEPAQPLRAIEGAGAAAMGRECKGYSSPCCVARDDTGRTPKGWASLWTVAGDPLGLGVHAGCILASLVGEQPREGHTLSHSRAEPADLSWPPAARWTAIASVLHFEHCGSRRPSNVSLLPTAGSVCTVWGGMPLPTASFATRVPTPEAHTCVMSPSACNGW